MSKLTKLTDTYKTDFIKDLAQLMNSGFNYDSIVSCGNKPNVVDFEVHSVILGARSSYFRLASSLNYPLRKSGVFLFDLKDIEPNIFELLLKYFYTSNIELNSISHAELFKLLIACDELVLSSIIDNIQTCLINNHSNHFESDPLSYLIKLYTCKRCSTLKTWLIQQLLQNPKSLIFNSPHFNSVSKELLVELFQRRYEDVDEIEIWWKFLEWSVHQANFSVYYSPSPFDYDIRELNLDEFESWDDKECERVKQILSEIIILLRWKEISFENFIAHISPHQKLFPPSLYENILSYYKVETKFQPSDQTGPTVSTIIVPRYSLQQYYNSSLISPSHFNIISSWIDRKGSGYYHKRLLPYKFTLLYRASRDGFDSSIFHERCDNKGATIMIAKVYLGGKIIGGYNPLDWKSQEQIETSESSSNVKNVENDNNNGIVKNEFSIILKDGTIIYNNKSNIIDTNSSYITPTTTSSSKLQRHIWMDTKDAFLFSFQHLLPNTGVLSRVVKSYSHKAVCYDPLSGPGFGAGLDIVVSNRYKMISTWGHYSYPEAQYFLAEQHSEIEDYEVFQVERDENIPIDDNDEEEKVSYEESEETKEETREEVKEEEMKEAKKETKVESKERTKEETKEEKEETEEIKKAKKETEEVKDEAKEETKKERKSQMDRMSQVD
ncbi:hypothetical protein Glove_359g22 [Diversispora epigaea]|uniref:BTB domain-containing protein n=1 Tax=Diversispora epigaea TaxID=1348612 RepID=A0A397HHX1_9GLOM|nr:hypothetical protein Glove_359g22 [Diversispora epigaea]